MIGLPEKLVSSVQVDLSHLATLRDVIRAADIDLPTGLTLKNDPRAAVFSLAAARKARLEAATAEGAVVAAPAAEAKAPAAGKKEEKKDDKKRK